VSIKVGIDSKKVRKEISVNGKKFAYYSIDAAGQAGLGDFSKLPAALNVVLENLLRFEDGKTVNLDDIKAFSDWAKKWGQNFPRNRLSSCSCTNARFYWSSSGSRFSSHERWHNEAWW
jgi:aconitase A